MSFYWPARNFCLLFCKFYFHLEAIGKEHIPRKGGFVVASNHASFLDPVLLGSACPRGLNFAARDSLFKNPLLRYLISNVGAFPIKRWSADLAAVKESVRRLSLNAGLVVFPEGTRSPDGLLQPMSHGFALLAAKACVPIIPAWISGSYKAWGKKSKIMRPVKITVVFGQPLWVEKKQPYPEVARKVFDRIKDLSKTC